MSVTTRWKIHRALVDRLGIQRPFTKWRSGGRVLFLNHDDPICHAQLFPFWYHRRELKSVYAVETREMGLHRLLASPRPPWTHVDAVAFQTNFDVTPEALRELITRLQRSFPGARLAYLDWFAPTDLRYASVLDGAVNAYVKKQLLRDREQYGRATIGDTNLTDYYAPRFGIQEPRRHFSVPEGLWSKVWLAPHFAFSPEIMDRLLRRFPEGSRDIDLNARVAVSGTAWYGAMRREALEAALALGGRYRVASRGRLPRREFFREMERSRLCFSPFGYGEVCWRDFEAMCTGALLLKPDMGHIECYPASFVPYQTYVPLKWDLSDLEEKVSYYLDHDGEREAIARQAFSSLAHYFEERRFVVDVEPLLQKLQLVG